MKDTKVSKNTLESIKKNVKLNWKVILLEIWINELKDKGVSYDEFISKLNL